MLCIYKWSEFNLKEIFHFPIRLYTQTSKTNSIFKRSLQRICYENIFSTVDPISIKQNTKTHFLNTITSSFLSVKFYFYFIRRDLNNKLLHPNCISIWKNIHDTTQYAKKNSPFLIEKLHLQNSFFFRYTKEDEEGVFIPAK